MLGTAGSELGAEEAAAAQLEAQVPHDYRSREAHGGGGFNRRRRRRSMHRRTQAHTCEHGPLTDRSAITQMDLERHLALWALCLGPPEDSLSWEANHTLI